MIGTALRGIITGAAEQHLEIDKEKRALETIKDKIEFERKLTREDAELEAKRQADAMAIKRINDMEDFKQKEIFKTEQSIAKSKAMFESLGIGGMGGGALPEGVTPEQAQVASAYAAQGNYGKAMDVLAQPNLYASKNTKQEEDTRNIDFKRTYNVEFNDGKTFTDVLDSFNQSLTSGGASPIIDNSPSGIAKGQAMFEGLARDLVSKQIDSGRVGNVSSSTLKTVTMQTVRAAGSVKEFIKQENTPTVIQHLKQLDALVPELQNVYDSTGTNNYNVFRNRNVFDPNELGVINSIIKENPKEFPNLVKELSEVKARKQNLQEKGMAQTATSPTLQPRSFRVESGKAKRWEDTTNTTDEFDNVR